MRYDPETKVTRYCHKYYCHLLNYLTVCRNKLFVLYKILLPIIPNVIQNWCQVFLSIRRQSTPDSRADIVRCVEYRDSNLSPHRYTPHRITTTHAVCDLIPHADHHTSPLLPQPEYMARVCLELGVVKTPPTEKPAPLLTCSVDFEPYTDKHFDTSKEACTICVQSNPDVSKITSPPIKSCLKKTKTEFSSSISLPSMEVKEDLKVRHRTSQ